jgi:hypothetical protein
VVHGLGDLNGQFAPQHDILWFAVKEGFDFKNGRPKSVLRFTRVEPERLLHPNEKPIKLMRYLVEKLTQRAEIVIDPFMGSGTTGVAALHLCRNFIGFELSEEYFKVAEERIRATTKQALLPAVNGGVSEPAVIGIKSMSLPSRSLEGTEPSSRQVGKGKARE